MNPPTNAIVKCPIWITSVCGTALVLCFPGMLVMLAIGIPIGFLQLFVTASLSTYSLSVLAGRRDRSDRWVSAIGEMIVALRNKGGTTDYGKRLTLDENERSQLIPSK